MAPTADDRLVLAHGFTQSAGSWDDIRGRFDQCKIATVAVDLPGHGTASEVRADLRQSADRLVHIGGRSTYVGYSMGGRVALHAALECPDLVRRLVLIGATAGIVDEDERAERRSADDRLADHIVDVGVERFVDEWLATPLFAHLTPVQAQRSLRLANTTHGLSSSLRSTGTGTQEPLWERLPTIEAPTLLMVGEHDAKFRSIAERMVDLLPDAELRVIADSGHSVHLEQPQATVDAVVRWMR